MKKTGFALALAAMLVVPTGAMAKPTKADSKAASKECHALQEGAVSKANFQQLGFKNFGDCVSRKSREEAAERRAARREARAECKSQDLKGKERSRCVKAETKSNKAKADKVDKNRIRATRSCRSDQEADVTTFNETYGGKRNAFGKCVSQTTKALNKGGSTE